jgi:hypothetical protein
MKLNKVLTVIIGVILIATMYVSVDADDNTPPEMVVKYDKDAQEFFVEGKDNVDDNVDVTILEETPIWGIWTRRLYHLEDDNGNFLRSYVVFNENDQRIRIHVLSLIYSTGESSTLHINKYTIKDRPAGILMEASYDGKPYEEQYVLTSRYDRTDDQTLITLREGTNEREGTRNGFISAGQQSEVGYLAYALN